MDSKKIGFIGLGRMGLGMANNLLRARVPLAVYDVSEQPLQQLVADGVSVASDPADLASRVDLLFVCVPSDTESTSVLFGDRGVANAKEGLPVVDTTTMNHGAALRLAERSRGAGLNYADCPISGMPFRAEDGTLTMMFGGTDEQFLEAKPFLNIMGEFIVHCGDVGMGQLMKAVNNIIYDVNIAALSEVMPIAVRAGLSVETLAEVLTTASSRSFASEYFVPKMLRGEFEGDFSLSAAYKDIVNMREVASKMQVSLPVVDAMVSSYDAAIEMGNGHESKSAMLKVYEERFQQKVRLAKETTSASTE